jgi:hypothetical protein
MSPVVGGHFTEPRLTTCRVKLTQFDKTLDRVSFPLEMQTASEQLQ